MITFSDYDKYLFHEGTHHELYRVFGAHKDTEKRKKGIRFRLWAPNALDVQLICSVLNWEEEPVEMKRNEDGIWSCFLSVKEPVFSYRYRIRGKDGEIRYKSDPFSFRFERRPSNATVYTEFPAYDWKECKRQSENKDIRDQAVSIYEVHLGSWKCKTEAGNQESLFLNYREYALLLSEYCSYMGYTHVELMGICEHPFDGSWGYQVNGYFAPTSRYGTPEDFMWMVDHLHQKGIGVILDWVPGHFVKDSFSLGEFDGSHLYESSDPLRQSMPEWGTYSFDLEKPEVQSYLLSSAYFWLCEYHIDGIRIDAVASILYLNFGRQEWRPNIFGGNENLEGFGFLKKLNNMVHEHTSGFTAAEDSSIIPGVTAPVAENGLGFDFKWNMGWMHDTLSFMKTEPVFRNYHRDQMKATLQYSWMEHYILVLSHDEVVHLKKSMIGKMPGRFEDKTGNLKAYYTWMFLHPGKKLLFMGQDFGQDREWEENREIDWYFTQDQGHRDLMLTVKELNRLYRETGFLQKYDCDPDSFQWNDLDVESSDVLSFLRFPPGRIKEALVLAVNFSGVLLADRKINVPASGNWTRVFSSYDFLPGQGGPLESGYSPVLLSVENRNGTGNQVISYSLRPFEAVIFRKTDF